MNAVEPTFRREAIAELMRREGLDASGFARRAAVSRTLIGAWIAGVVTPQVGTLMRLCRVFSVPVAFFFKNGGSTVCASEMAQQERANRECAG